MKHRESVVYQTNKMRQLVWSWFLTIWYPDTSKNHEQGIWPCTLIHLRNMTRASEPVPCCLCYPGSRLLTSVLWWFQWHGQIFWPWPWEVLYPIWNAWTPFNLYESPVTDYVSLQQTDQVKCFVYGVVEFVHREESILTQLKTSMTMWRHEGTGDQTY